MKGDQSFWDYDTLKLINNFKSFSKHLDCIPAHSLTINNVQNLLALKSVVPSLL